MSYRARFSVGSRVWDLNSTTCQIARGFVPPATSEAPQIAGGLATNRRGGKLVGRSVQDSGISLAVIITGSSNGQVRTTIDSLAQFLKLAGNDTEPLYFEWRPDNHVSFEPTWGQWNAVRRVEVLWGEVTYPTGYGWTRDRVLECTINLVVKPYALSKKQRLMTATGGIGEDVYGPADGISRGLIVGEATTNKFTNPVQGGNTWSVSGWTASNAALKATYNQDKRLIWFKKKYSAWLTNTSTSTVYNWTQSINVGNTNTHVLSFLVKRADEAAVSSSDCVIYYGAAKTTTFVSLGNGWYRAYASFAGINASTDAGIEVKAGRQVFVDGFVLEEKTYPTPAGYGDLLGWSWSGTAHASTSSRAAGKMHLDAAWMLGTSSGSPVGEGTICLTWLADKANTALGADKTFVDIQSGFTLYYDESAAGFVFSDGTTTLSAAKTFAAGDLVVLHCVFEAAGLALYVNGALGDSDTPYTPPALSYDLYVGSNYSGATQPNGTIMGLTVYGQAMSATEAANDYANIAAAAGAGKRIDWIAWLWTDGGDNLIDNVFYDTYNNSAVVGGIAGSAPGLVKLRSVCDRLASTPYLYNLARRSFVGKVPAIGTSLFFDLSGTADASGLGGEVKQTSTSTTELSIGTGTVTSETAEFVGMEFYVIARIKTSGAGDVYLRPYGYYGNASYVFQGEQKLCALTTSYKVFNLGKLVVPEALILQDTPAMTIGVKGQTKTGTVTLSLDFVQILPRPMMTVRES